MRGVVSLLGVTPEESPTERQPAKWVGSASVPQGDPNRRRRQFEDTLDLPVVQEPAAPPQIRYVPVPVPGPPPPHGAYPPAGYQPPRYRRRRRKWPWVMLLLAALCLGCCGGAVAWAKPYWDQYPATAVPGATVPGLTKIEDSTAKRNADRLRKSIDSDHLDEADFTAVYQDVDNRQQRVTVFGATRFIVDPERDLDASLRKLTADLQLKDVREVDEGPFGGHQRCGTGRLAEQAISVCAWADHGSIAVALFTRRTLEESGPMLHNIRGSLIQRT